MGKFALFVMAIVVIMMVAMAVVTKSKAAESGITKNEVLVVGEKSVRVYEFLVCREKDYAAEIIDTNKDFGYVAASNKAREFLNKRLCVKYMNYIFVAELYEKITLDYDGVKNLISLVRVKATHKNSSGAEYFAALVGFEIIDLSKK